MPAQTTTLRSTALVAAGFLAGAATCFLLLSQQPTAHSAALAQHPHAHAAVSGGGGANAGAAALSSTATSATAQDAFADHVVTVDFGRVNRPFRRMAAHPTGMMEAAYTWHLGELWVVSSFPCGDVNGTNVWRYRPAADEWVPGPPLPGYHLHHVFGAAFSVVEGQASRLVVLGGIRSGGYGFPRKPGGLNNWHATSVLVLDTTSSPEEAGWAWAHVNATAPPGSADPVPMLGGITSCSHLADFGAAGSGSSSTEPPPPLGSRTHHCLMSSGGNFLSDEARFIAFDPATLVVTVLPLPPPQARTNHVSLLLDAPRRRLLMTPGRTDLASELAHMSFVYEYGLDTGVWAQHASLPYEVAAFEARGTWHHPSGQYALLVGGQDAREFLVSPLIYRAELTGPTIDIRPWGLLPYGSFAQAVTGVPPGVPGAEAGGVYIFGGSKDVGPICAADGWVWTPPATAAEADAALGGVSLLRPMVFAEGAGTAAVARSLAARALAQAAATPLPPPRLRVLAAWYGPFVITDRLQALLDSGVRSVMLGSLPLGGLLTVVLPDVRVYPQALGRYPLTALLLETAPASGLPFPRTVSCHEEAACLFY
jgi:hypothetical protein